MNGLQGIWLAAALLSAVLVALAVRHPRAGPAQSERAAWLVGATTSGLVVIWIAAKVTHVLPHATAVDVGALAVAGILTGVFLTLGLKPGRSNGAS